MNKIYRNLNSDLSVNEESRHIVGYAAVFDKPSSDIGFIETIKRGAITQELCDSCDVFCLFDHDKNKVLARSNHGKGSLTLTVDNYGLKYEFDAPKTYLGDEVLEYISRGDVKQSSFCFSISNDDNSQKWEKIGEKYYRTIYKIDKLYDCAIVWTPAYPDTTCDKRSFEEAKERLSKEIDNKMNLLKLEIEMK